MISGRLGFINQGSSNGARIERWTMEDLQTKANALTYPIEISACEALNAEAKISDAAILSYVVERNGEQHGCKERSIKIVTLSDHIDLILSESSEQTIYMTNSGLAEIAPIAGEGIFREVDRYYGKNIFPFSGKGTELYNTKTKDLKGTPASHAGDILGGSRDSFADPHTDKPLIQDSVIAVTLGFKLVMMAPPDAKGERWAQNWGDGKMVREKLPQMAQEAREAGGEFAILLAGRMCKIGAQWHHAVWNLDTTLSVNITHCADYRHLVQGLLLTLKAYPSDLPSPVFGPGLFHIVKGCVRDLEKKKFDTWAEQIQVTTEVFGPVYSTLILLYSKAYMMKGVQQHKDISPLCTRARQALAKTPLSDRPRAV